MKKKFMICPNCKEETIHSLWRRFSSGGRSAGKLKRECLRCDQCGATTIKNKSKTWTRPGLNEMKIK